MTDTGAGVAESLRAADRLRFFATLFQPAPARDDAQALFAFSAEVAAIGQRVRDPVAGEIRLQWWHDALAGAGHGDVARSPVAAGLMQAMRRNGLPADPLLRLLEARRFDLYDDPMPDRQSFEGYAGETSSVLYQMNVAILDGGRFPVQGDAAGHAGVAHALIGHLHAFGANAARGVVALPLAAFQEEGVGIDDIFATGKRAEVTRVLATLAALAQEHLERAEFAARQLPPVTRPAFVTLPALRLRLAAFDPTRAYAPQRMPAEWRQLAAMAFWLLKQR